MKQFTTEQLQDHFAKLPKDLQEAVSSAEVRDSVEKIGKKYGLHIDQLGEMVDLVGLIMLGLSPSKDFVRNFSQEAGVKTDIATSIAEDINNEVFGKIRSSMQAIEAKDEAVEAQKTKAEQSITDLERIGGFSIEPSTGQDGDGTAPANLPGAEEVDESPDELIAGIENPPPIKTSNSSFVRPSSPVPEENHTDIIVDHLLTGPVAAGEQKTIQIPEPAKSAPIEPKKPVGPDPYKEPIN